MLGASNVRVLGFLGAAFVLASLWILFGQSGGTARPPPLDPAALREIVGPLSAHVKDREPWLRVGFQDGTESTTHDEDVTVEVRVIGTLHVRSGRIVACDPIILFPEPRAFDRLVSNGDYPVEVSIIHRPDGDERIAMARVRLTAHAPVAFQLAPFEGQSLEDLLDTGEVTGHSVESGTTAFLDSQAALTLWARRQSGTAHDLGFLEAMKRSFEPTRGWAQIEVDGAAGNLVLFSAGLGDTFCPCFWGYDAWGEIAALIIDCNILGDAE